MPIIVSDRDRELAEDVWTEGNPIEAIAAALAAVRHEAIHQERGRLTALRWTGKVSGARLHYGPVQVAVIGQFDGRWGFIRISQFTLADTSRVEVSDSTWMEADARKAAEDWFRSEKLKLESPDDR